MKSSRIAGLAALCLLSGSGWLIEQFYPREIFFPFAGFIHFTVIGTVAMLVWLATERRTLSIAKAGWIALSGMGVFALPSIAPGVSAGAVSEFTTVALFCAIPLMTVLILNASEWPGPGVAGPRALLSGVFGVGGALLLLPAQLPGAARGWIFFCLIAVCCTLVAFAGIAMHRMIQGVPIAIAVALTGFGCAAALGMYSAAIGAVAVSLRSVGFECVRCLLYDLPVMWLSIWLIREIDPGRLSARFLWVPLITAIEGYAVMRGGVDLQAGLGMILIGGSGILLIKGEARDDEQNGSSLHLALTFRQALRDKIARGWLPLCTSSLKVKILATTSS